MENTFHKTINVKSLLWLMAIGTAITLPTILGSFTPAYAKLPPECVKTKLDDGRITDTLKVKNTCKKSHRIKVVLAFHTDLACTTIRPDKSKEFSWRYPGRFDRLESC